MAAGCGTAASIAIIWLYGIGFDWKFTETLQWTIEAFGQAGQSDTPSVVQPRFQTGVRYRPNEIFSVDLIYGRNITGENANWITLGTTIRFRCPAASPSTSARAICRLPSNALRRFPRRPISELRFRKIKGQGGSALAEFVKIEKGLGPDGRIAVVRFDRGDGINALSPEALRQLTDAARSFEDDGETSVVVLTGGAKSFTAGFDLKDPEGRSRASPWISARCAGT